MKKLTRTIAVQPVRVFFISSVIVIGKPIRFTPVREQSLCQSRGGLSSPTRRLDSTLSASALEGFGYSSDALSRRSHNFG